MDSLVAQSVQDCFVFMEKRTRGKALKLLAQVGRVQALVKCHLSYIL
jgi:hypothetical protein